MKKALPLFTFFLALMFVASQAVAAPKKNPKPHPTPTPPPVMKTKPDIIEQVSATSIAVRHIKETRNKNMSITETPVTYTYTITRSTAILVNGQEAKVEAIKVGMKVSVSTNGTPGQNPPLEATDIHASDSHQ